MSKGIEAFKAGADWFKSHVQPDAVTKHDLKAMEERIAAAIAESARIAAKDQGLLDALSRRTDTLLKTLEALDASTNRPGRGTTKGNT